MGKKLKRFEQLKSFSNVIQPKLSEVLCKSFFLKNNWHNEYFKNNNPIVLEIGCGKGEYTVELAKLYPNKNFIGVDIKGYRLYVGAKQALLSGLTNVAFVRTRAEFIDSIFGQNEISELWLTFPDPQQKKRWTKKRLTSALFLNKYNNFLSNGSFIHLKTDSDFLYHYTFELLKMNSIEIIEFTTNVYQSNLVRNDPALNIKTYYEELFVKLGFTIKYIKWKTKNVVLKELPDEKIEELISIYPRSVIPKRQLF
ncbi:MAG: tRNA (guanosine(46)-N7)-methyltransferase TrmB [Bacteroidales bacterium]|nr:tRNA (guanosine(46)-N7)-methyltransferase TrmB [Bacteroidales bacterium]